MKRPRIFAASRSVTPAGGWSSVRAQMKRGPAPASAASSNASKCASSVAQVLCARPAPLATATRSTDVEVSVGCEPVIW